MAVRPTIDSSRSDEIERQTQAFLAKGGKIQVIPPGIGKDTPPEEEKLSGKELHRASFSFYPKSSPRMENS